MPYRAKAAIWESSCSSLAGSGPLGNTYPITMTRGQPQARQLCYGAVVIRDRKYSTLPGPSLYCEKNGKPLANPDDY